MPELLRLVFDCAWQPVCLLEVVFSTVIHVSYVVCLIVYALFADVLSWARIRTTVARRIDSRGSIVSDDSSQLMKDETRTAAAPHFNFSTDIPILNGNCSHAQSGTKISSLKHRYIAPIVLIHGIFGFGHGKFGGLSYFGNAELKDERVLVPDLGSLTSLHDRACELFYYLKGGTVDYGEDHSNRFGHNRFGKTYEKGHHPDWSEDQPVHFVGHSSGAQVARLLQTMLAENYFEGHGDSNERWVSSITAISGALNGTTRVYLDGICSTDGWSMPGMTLLQILRIGVLLMEWINFAPIGKYYSWGFDHFDLAWHKVGLRGLYLTLSDKMGPFHSGDWILPDLSIQSSMELNRKLQSYSSTYYFSYATMRTRKVLGYTVPSPGGIHPLFFLRSLQMSRWKYPKRAKLPYRGYRDEDWHDNDGALNTISMLYPRLPVEHPHMPLRLGKRERQKYKPGIWYYTILDADHITFILDSSRAGIHFDVLYDSIFQRCRRHFVIGSNSNDMAEYSCGDCVHVCDCSRSRRTVMN